ncbi:unnamed protein product, partial [Coregonus sp. 'balchen']
MGVMPDDSQGARVAVSPPMSPKQQPYIQYLHSYQYIQILVRKDPLKERERQTGRGPMFPLPGTFTHITIYIL